MTKPRLTMTSVYLLHRLHDDELSLANQQAIINELVEYHGFEAIEHSCHHEILALDKAILVVKKGRTE